MTKKIETILFDLDGTLLPMHEEQFVGLYLHSIADEFKDSYDPKLLQQTLWEGTGLMASNHTDQTNEDLMWELLESRFPGISRDKDKFAEYYRTRFDEAQAACPRREGTGEFLQKLAKQYKLILATNPLFPREAVEQRLKWAGVDPKLFSWITTYENSTRCKPDPAYYREIIENTGVDPQTCLMVGNDATEDMAALETGMHTYLVTDCLINRQDLDLDHFEWGTFEDFEKKMG